jgi:hypothetical protein
MIAITMSGFNRLKRQVKHNPVLLTLARRVFR